MNSEAVVYLEKFLATNTCILCGHFLNYCMCDKPKRLPATAAREIAENFQASIDVQVEKAFTLIEKACQSGFRDVVINVPYKGLDIFLLEFTSLGYSITNVGLGLATVKW